MARFAQAIGAAFTALGRILGTLFGALWILLLLALTIWLSVGSLAAIQVRAQLAEDEQELSFNDVQRAYEKYQERKAQIDRRLEAHDAVAEAFRDVDGAVEAIYRRLVSDELPDGFNPVAYSSTPEFMTQAEACAPQRAAAADPGSFADASGAIDPAAAPDPAPPGDDAVAPEPAATLADAEDPCPLFADYDRLLSRAFQIDPAESAASYEAALLEAQEQTDELQSQEHLFKHFSAYEFFQFIGAPKLLLIPSEVLVLVVTMAMGVLGAAVSMTWLFIRQDGSMTARRFLILPLIGAVSAFIVFMFVRAGQLTLTTGDAEDSLNPFVLSFIGVISGMLSERAYNRITEVGTSFFDVDDGQPRWGCRLSDALQSAGVSEAELARYLGVSEEEAGRIVKEATTATFEQQRLIAAALRRTVREIFTDVPPDAPSSVAAAPSVAVPPLVGLDAAAAAEALAAAGLALGETATAADPAAPPGQVLAQRPPAETRVARGARIDLTVAGEDPQPT
ncbi:helix-turn-helix transcriptional regulator [Amaricoccus sp.]|uniref:helix-turn-helix domain-containing protein n=1 Tax=Amaricoccus sp. TaxID=1872485 RepID=UPI001B7A55CD|nr:helix-turn-helix transcriptional regulator [Amaricoccus sp.]MBP7002970.1 helix-turn-helix transcriptional regulator [Amaricoccus sp.]